MKYIQILWLLAAPILIMGSNCFGPPAGGEIPQTPGIPEAITSRDSDGDGTADYFDACPGDPNKTKIGTCGCTIDDSLGPQQAKSTQDLENSLKSYLTNDDGQKDKWAKLALDSINSCADLNGKIGAQPIIALLTQTGRLDLMEKAAQTRTVDFNLKH